MMPIEYLPDWDVRLARQDAFWSRQVIDRPVCCITLPRSNPDYPHPGSRHATLRDRWVDAEYVAQPPRLTR